MLIFGPFKQLIVYRLRGEWNVAPLGQLVSMSAKLQSALQLEFNQFMRVAEGACFVEELLYNRAMT